MTTPTLPPPTGTIAVLLADDHPVVRSGYASLLEQSGGLQVVAQAGDCDAAEAAWHAHRPDVTVTDLSMPGGGGLELIRRILAADASARLLVFSMHDGAPLVERALALGARGFLAKSSAPQDLVDAVRALHAGQRYIGAGLAAPRPGHDAHAEAGRLASLTPREFEVFRLLAQGHSVADCARLLAVSAKTVSNQQTLVKEKLDVETTAALVHFAIRHGVVDAAGGLGVRG